MILRWVRFSIYIFLIIGISPFVVHAQETENVSVSATVPAKPEDYQLSVTADPRDSRQSQNSEIHYVITYGSNLNYDTEPFIIRATLLPGRINGSPISSLYIADIVQGKATNGYMMTSPMIDTISHTITWTIPSLPAQKKNQTISFTLKTNTAYTGSDVVDFDVNVKAIAPDITLTAVMSESYMYKEPPAVITPSPTPTPEPIRPVVTSLTTNQVTNNTVTFTLTTDIPTKVTATATSISNKSSQVIQDPRIGRWHQITISNLLPNTSYLISVVVTDTHGQSTKSTTMSIHTTISYTPIQIDVSSLVISSLDTIFQPDVQSLNRIGSPFATLPINTPYTFQLRIPDAKKIIRMQGIVTDTQVLGISIDSLLDTVVAKEPETSTEMIDMAELTPSIFTGTLKTKPTSGVYELRVRITDVNNNITEHLIGTVSVVHPFTVKNENTGEPIEHARIFLSRYFPKTGQYTPLSPTFVSTRNPLFTNSKGEASFVLPEGTYKALITFQGTEKTVLFAIDNYKHAGFPVVSITPSPLSAAGYLQYYSQNTLDILVNSVIIFGASVGSSQHLFEAFSAFILILLFFMTLLAFSSRTLIPITSIPRYIIHGIHLLISSPSHIYISGTVLDGSTRKPISLADVTIIDISTDTIATMLKTDKSGRYFFKVDNRTSFRIDVRKNGYVVVEPVVYQPELSPAVLTHVLHTHHPNHVHYVAHLFVRTIQTLLGASFEVLIVLTGVLELLFIRYFGFTATLPYIFASVVTIVLWISYVHHTRTLSSN